MALQAVFLYSSMVFCDHPTLSDNDREACRDLLDPIEYSYSQATVGNLISDIYRFHHGPALTGKPRNLNARHNQFVERVFDNYRQVMAMSRIRVPDLRVEILDGLGQFFQSIGKKAEDTVQVFFHINLSEVAQRTKESNPAWCESNEGQIILSEVDKIINSRLPAARQFKMFPHSTFKAQYIIFTEKQLKAVSLALPSRVPSGKVEPRWFLSMNPAEKIHFGAPASSVWRSEGAQEVKSSKSEFYDFVQGHIHYARDCVYLLQSQRYLYQGRRRILSGYISTNGNDLKVLAYAINRNFVHPDKRPPPAKSARDFLDAVEWCLDTPAKVLAEALHPDINRCLEKVLNLTVSQGSLGQAFDRHSRMLEQEKAKASLMHSLPEPDEDDELSVPIGEERPVTVYQLESHIKSVNIPVGIDDWGTFWNGLRRSVEDHAISIAEVLVPLRAFYRSRHVKFLEMCAKQAKVATMQRSVDCIIQATGFQGLWRQGQIRPLFVIGDDEFGKKDDLHLEFIKVFKRRAEGRGMRVMCASERNTSIAAKVNNEMSTAS
ncbi:hypothetical protein BGX33_011367 [Mortierella sp. NVP41]|nr:hypothetical protein BGX33_011367 [Mortierella sp. NVP41]